MWIELLNVINVLPLRKVVEMFIISAGLNIAHSPSLSLSLALSFFHGSGFEFAMNKSMFNTLYLLDIYPRESFPIPFDMLIFG